MRTQMPRKHSAISHSIKRWTTKCTVSRENGRHCRKKHTFLCGMSVDVCVCALCFFCTQSKSLLKSLAQAVFDQVKILQPPRIHATCCRHITYVCVLGLGGQTSYRACVFFVYFSNGRERSWGVICVGLGLHTDICRFCANGLVPLSANAFGGEDGAGCA